MKKALNTIALLLLSHAVFSQIDHIEILVGYPETYVTKYLDSLNALKSNPNHSTKRTVSDSGVLVLSCAFSAADEKYYNCNGIIVKFQRQNGIDYCVTQVILGDAEYAQSNFTYIKDHFKVITSGVGEQDIPGTEFKVVATTFTRVTGDKPLYKIRYDLKNIK